MTEIEEAIDKLRSYIWGEEIPSIENCGVAIKALQKQIPKKPIGTDWTHNCPCCDVILGSGIGSVKVKFCPECGQAINLTIKEGKW